MFRLENAQSLVGLILCVGVCWLLSENRARFPWRLAVGALVMQAVIVLALFAVPQSRAILLAINAGVDAVAAASAEGSKFVFGYLAGGDQPFPIASATGGPFVFAFQVLPIILVISTLSALLWHWKILKWVIRGFGYVFQRTMGLGGASALAAAVNVFLGNVECALVVKGYLDKFSRSEIFLMMTLGMATVAGSTMVAYAVILKASIPNAAGHVLAASLISAPAGVLLARILVPETPGEGGENADYASMLAYDSAMEAVVTGIADGLQVVMGIAATLIVFIALATLTNGLLGWLLPWWGGEPISLQRMLGVIFAPLAWSLGIEWKDAGAAGRLLGDKLVLTEIAAFLNLAANSALSERTRLLLTYALCGFANIASVGIIVGGLTVLIPDRRREITDLVWKALLAGFLATCMTASVVGLLPREVFQ